MLSLLALAAVASAQSSGETIHGVYMFHRHGDRTPKALAPTSLTSLGYNQVYSSGQFFRSHYLPSSSNNDGGSNSTVISSISPDLVNYQQLAVSSPQDNVLQTSAQGFLQGLYPPVGSTLSTETLRDGTSVQSPMDGYQLIPVNTVSMGTGSEDSSWLQSTSNCAKAQISSNDYFASEEYRDLLQSTKGFYQSLEPVLSDIVGAENVESQVGELSFKNAYTIYDLISLSLEQNATLPNTTTSLTPSVLAQLHSLANTHEYNLAYNSSSPIRAVSGSLLAAEVLAFFNTTLSTEGKKNKFGVQFGAYATFTSFFSLAGLPQVDEQFTRIVDFASVMVWEVFSQSSSSSDFPAEDDIFVRFRFHNGMTTSADELVTYPLFGSKEDVLSYKDFVAGMQNFSIGTTEQWCTACGNVTGECAAYASPASASSVDGKASGASGNGLSPVVNGVIGAMVTLAIVLGLEALVLLIGGFRVVRKWNGSEAQVGEVREVGKA